MTGNTFHGPAGQQAGDHNVQHNHFRLTGPREPAGWPHRVGPVPRRAAAFQCRGEAARLRRVVAGGGTAVLSQVLTGTGGVGKTQLAADFAHEVWERGERLLSFRT